MNMNMIEITRLDIESPLDMNNLQFMILNLLKI